MALIDGVIAGLLTGQGQAAEAATILFVYLARVTVGGVKSGGKVTLLEN